MIKSIRPAAVRPRFAASYRAAAWLAVWTLVLQSLTPLAQGLPGTGAGERPMLICKIMQAGTAPSGRQAPDERSPDPASCPVCTAAAFVSASLSPPEAFPALPEGGTVHVAVAGTALAPSGRGLVAHGARAPPAAV